MRQLNGKVPSSPVHRFLLGAGFGVAISVPIFVGIENITLRLIFMLGFAGMIGASQMFVGGTENRLRKTQGWLLAAGAVVLIVGIVLFFSLR